MTDHYATLSIPRDANAETITRAWRAAASNYHPDKMVLGVMENAQDFAKRREQNIAKFHAAREAFNCLMDRAARTSHDATLNGHAEAGLLSEDDYNELSTRRDEQENFKPAPGPCMMCGGSGELRVAQRGFWLRKDCPACGP
jgi:DnaJ-class molecular chaperone